MKEYIQELGLSTADIVAITPQVIADTIEEIARYKRVFGQFYKKNTDLMTSGGKAMEFPRKGSGITAIFSTATSGVTLSASSMSYSAVTITVGKGGVGLAINGEAIRQANRDVLADAIQEAGDVWADTLDLLALETMFPSVTASATASTVTSIAACSLPIGFKSIIGTAGSLIIASPISSSLVFPLAGATITMWYIPTTVAGQAIGCKQLAGQATSFTARDILNLRGYIIGKTMSPSVILMHPDRLTEILYDATVKFLEKSAYEGQGPVYTGELGKIWGLNVIVSNKVPKYGIISIDPRYLGYEVWRKDMKIVRDDYTGMNQDELRFWGFAELNYGITNAAAYGALAMGVGTYSFAVLTTN
uniref:Putative capsid protein n=1 Tax=viral metagenome TaxID=1070528 RepID=A0A6H1ZKK9_9ZZZZ